MPSWKRCFHYLNDGIFPTDWIGGRHIHLVGISTHDAESWFQCFSRRLLLWRNPVKHQTQLFTITTTMNSVTFKAIPKICSFNKGPYHGIFWMKYYFWNTLSAQIDIWKLNSADRLVWKVSLFCFVLILSLCENLERLHTLLWIQIDPSCCSLWSISLNLITLL